MSKNRRKQVVEVIKVVDKTYPSVGSFCLAFRAKLGQAVVGKRLLFDGVNIFG